MAFRVFGVLLVFYPNYFESSFSVFNYLPFLNKTKTPKVIVNNGSFSAPFTDCVIKGDNEFWEFSGWEKARQIFIQDFNLSDEDVVIFANDTFCQHRFFTQVDSFLLLRTLLKAKKIKGPWLAGEYCSPKFSYSILGLRSFGWISTYLFAANGVFLKNLSSMHLSRGELSSTISCILPGQIIFSEMISQSLAGHINKWLFPMPGCHGWYNSKRLDPKLLDGKVKSILNEKFLSAKCFDMGGKLLNLYQGPIGTHYLSLRHWLFHKGILQTKQIK